jgi:hypothetical protein
MTQREVIGKVACGVAISKRSVYYTSLSDEYIGKKGVITVKKGGYFLIKFEGISLQYPINRLEEVIKLAETSSSEPTPTSNPDSSFPEKWCLKLSRHNNDMISKWRTGYELSVNTGYVMYEGYLGVRGYYELTKPAECTEITTEQFKEHVLKKKPKVVTKPAVKEWSVGTYAVAMHDYVNWSQSKMGDIYLIKDKGYADNLNRLPNGKNLLFTVPRKDFQWFATKQEAEAFAKTLTKEVVEEKVEYEVGKWYKAVDKNFFGKFLQFKSNWFWTTERSMDGEKDYSKSKFSFVVNEGYTWIPATIEELRNFLPKGHPDIQELESNTMSDEELLAYAREHYPVGTEFNNGNLFPSQTITNTIVAKDNHRWSGSIIEVSTRNALNTLYRDGQWAKIVKPAVMTEKQLIEEARTRYPVGTIFSNSNLGCGCDGIKVTGEGFYKDGWGKIVIYNLSNASNGRYTVYKDGKWAKVTTPASSLSQLIATKHWGPELVGRFFISDVNNLGGSICLRDKPYIIRAIDDVRIQFLSERDYFMSIRKNLFLEHCKLLPDYTAKVADDPKNVTIPEIQQTKSTVNYTVSTPLTELTVNIPNGRKTKQVPVITIELSHINCNL